MLTDTALRNLKPKARPYKVSDRDGMYVTVSPAGTATFRYDYRLNGRRETLTIGRYGPAGISLALAREKLLDAKRAISEGRSPAHEKQREKRRLTVAKHFGDMAALWLVDVRIKFSKPLSHSLLLNSFKIVLGRKTVFCISRIISRERVCNRYSCP